MCLTAGNFQTDFKQSATEFSQWFSREIWERMERVNGRAEEKERDVDNPRRHARQTHFSAGRERERERRGTGGGGGNCSK